MGITAISGPEIVSGDNSFEQNDDAGPSLFAKGQAFTDERIPFQYIGTSNRSPKFNGFPQQQLIQTINATVYPSVILAETPPLVDVTPGVPLPLITVAIPGATPGITVRESGTGRLIHNVVMMDDFNLIDYNGTLIGTTASSFDESGNVTSWDPSKLLARRVIIGGGGNPNEFFVTGIDVYGYLMADTITTVGGASTNSRKAFKGIISAIPTQVDSSPVPTVLGTFTDIGLPLRYDYLSDVLIYNSGIQDTTPTNFEPSLYAITSITPLAGILTITIAQSDAPFPSIGQPYTLPVGSQIIISRCNPVSYNGTYTILTSGPGTFTVASANVDAYVAGGSIFCDQGGLETGDVRGVYISPFSGPDPVNITVYQSISFQNMQTPIGQFGIPQFNP